MVEAIRSHPRWAVALALVLIGSIGSWCAIAMCFVNLAWRIEFRGTLRDRVLATVRLLERRADWPVGAAPPV